MESLTVQNSRSLILIASLGLFSFCWLVLSNFDVMVFVLSYILFCYILIMSLRSLFFFNETERECISMEGEVESN